MDFRNGVNDQGIGLGLMLVKSIADAMNGEVTFISHEGVGSEFKVTLEIGEVTHRGVHEENICLSCEIQRETLVTDLNVPDIYESIKIFRNLDDNDRPLSILDEVGNDLPNNPILIVDDETTNIFALKSILRIKFGLESDSAYDMKTSMDQLEKKHFAN